LEEGCDLGMSISTFASDFDDKAEPIDRSKHSAKSKRKADSYYKHSKYSTSSFRFATLASGAHQIYTRAE
jgi:hypothetical protein